ncbi:carbon-nitrogen hydrolase family protein [Arthrobacter sp. KNU-44]|uniref:carbon-nitrogen hydrolase family protein n=1 Tax=Arthrobacter sp. KNU-44 TaxID=3450744 RepID=UPI003F4202B0
MPIPADRPQLPCSELPIAIVQYQAVPGGVVANVASHAELATEAGRQGARLILFPELSLTGYDLQLLDEPESWVTQTDDRLEPLRSAARLTGAVIVVGGALRDRDGTGRLASIVLDPGSSRDRHAFKTHLHDKEHEYFTAGNGALLIGVNDWTVALAICLDAAHPTHAAEAAATNAHVYALAALYTHGQERRLDLHLGSRAMDNSLYTALANHAGAGTDWTSCGGSGTWGPDGTRRTGHQPTRGTTQCQIILDVLPGRLPNSVLSGTAPS